MSKITKIEYEIVFEDSDEEGSDKEEDEESNNDKSNEDYEFSLTKASGKRLIANIDLFNDEYINKEELWEKVSILRDTYSHVKYIHVPAHTGKQDILSVLNHSVDKLCEI